MTPWVIAASGLLGMVFGSFFNVVIDRVPQRQSVVTPGSHCDACGRLLAAWELVPVLSYAALGGRCRSCHAPIPVRIPLIELVSGLLFALATWRSLSGVEWSLSGWLCDIGFLSTLLILTVTDLEQRLIPDAVTGPAAVWGAVWGGLSLRGEFVGHLLTAVAAFLLFLLIAWLSRGGMGGGDVKLAGILGLYLGLVPTVVALFAGVVLGGLAGAVLLAARRRGPRDMLPFGPFLAVGGLVGWLAGQPLWAAYMTLLR